MEIVYMHQKLMANIIFQLFVSSITLCVTYGQMELTDQSGMNGLDFTNVLQTEGQGVMVDPNGGTTISDPAQSTAALQSTSGLSGENVDASSVAQSTGIQPASSVVGIFPSYRPQYGVPGYLPTLPPGRGILPGIGYSADNVIVTHFPGPVPPVVQPGNTVLPGGVLPGGVLPAPTGLKPGVPGSSTLPLPSSAITQQTIQSVLSYLAIQHPELITRYLIPKLLQKPYYGSHLPKWLKEISVPYKYSDEGVNQPYKEYGDIYPAEDYYDPVDVDLHYWPRRRRPISVLKRRRRYGLSKRFS
ncbi:hypothetical protein MN116_007203 [Schistosoma mekongi]|uniref:Uncharacterized protein n=1 Tax=Schistosoma mekongi TaxID=38744 RepID=A0AAE2D3D9_SCHME|nr:hypothetical protein MN116_007203 [Schistosoma mekongi]